MNKNINISIAYTNTFIFSCVQMILYVTIPYISEVSSISIAHIAGSISIGSLLFAFTGPFWASVSDKWGRKKVLAIGMAGLCLSFLLLTSIFALNPHLALNVKITLIYISRFLYGLLASAIVPVSQAWQLDLSPNTERIKVLTRNSMCLNLGRLLGPIIVLFKKVDFDQLIYVSTAIIMVLALFEIFSKSETNEEIKSGHSFNFANYKKLIHASVLPILLAIIFTSFIGILHSTLGHHLKVIFNIRGEIATLLMAKIVIAISLIGFLSQIVSQKLPKSKWKWTLNTGAITLLVGAFLLNAADTMPSMWIAVCILGVGLALIPPVYLALISKKNTNENVYGKQVGLASIAHSLGYALGAGIMALSLKMDLISITFAIVLVSIFTLLITLKISWTKEVY
ncbi:MAG: MFS transporter [Bdellovibrionales bacterium]|nr:MFS transporter [Bdellovibrionales bacterium]